MQLPRALRRINRRFSNRLFVHIARLVPPLAVVSHCGRKSGRAYRTPVTALRTRTGFIIPLGYGRDVDWVLNLLAAGGGTLTRAGQNYAVSGPQVVDGAAVAASLPAAVRGLLMASRLPGYLILQTA